MRKNSLFTLSIWLILSIIFGAANSANAQKRKPRKSAPSVAVQPKDPEELQALEDLQMAKTYSMLADLQLSLAAAYLQNRAVGERDAKRALAKLDVEQRKNPSSFATNFGQASGYLIWGDYLLKRNNFGKIPLSDKAVKAGAEIARTAVEKASAIDSNFPRIVAARADLRAIDCQIGKFSGETDCYRQPLEDFSRAIALSPDDDTIITQRAELFKRFNRGALAEIDEQIVKSLYDALDAKIKLDEKTTETQPYFAEHAEIETAYFLAVLRFTTDPEVRTELGRNPATAEAFREKLYEYYKNADKNYFEAIQAKPTAENLTKRADLRLDLSRATLLIEEKDAADILIRNLKEAVEFYSYAITTDPNYAKAYEQRAKANRELGNFDAAEADENKAKSLKK